MKNIFNVKLAKNEFNLLKTILFLIIIVYTFIIILAYTSINSYNARYADYRFTTNYMILVQLAYYTSIFIVSVYSFKYIYNRKALDMYHSLPIKRTTLLLTKLITGYISISILFAIAFYIVSSFNNLPPKEILQLLSLSLLSGLFEYSCFMLVATICNGIFFHIVLTASILFIPVLISLLISIFNQTYTFIYTSYSLGIVPQKIFDSFFVESYRNYDGSFETTMYNNNTQIIIFIAILTVLITCLSLYSYSLRKSENLSSYIIFKPVRIFFQSCITFIIIILIVRIFMSQVSIILIYIICIMLAIALTFIIDCVLNFKINNIKNNTPYYITPLLAILIFINVYDNNLYGAFNTPKLSNIQSATIKNNNTWYYESLEQYKDSGLIDLQQPELIDKLLQLQDGRFEEFKQDEYAFMSYTDLKVSYTLNNGETVLRSFSIDAVDYADTINYIQTNSSNKQDIIDLLSNATQYTTSIDLEAFTPINESKYKTDEVLNALIEDIKNDDTFRTVGYQSPIIGNALISIRDATSYSIDTPIPIKLDYTNTLQLLDIDINSFDVLAIPEEDIQGDYEVYSQQPFASHYLSRTAYILQAKEEEFPDSYYASEYSSVALDYLVDTLQLNNYTYLKDDDRSLYWNSQEYIDGWLPSSYLLHFTNNLIKTDNSQYYRTFIVIDDKVLMDSEQLVKISN